MPNPVETLKPAQLRQLYKLLGVYRTEIELKQSLASQVISLVRKWVESETRFDQ